MKTILDGAQLRNRIGREEFDYVQLKSVLADYARPDQKISELLKSGIILGVKKGLYVFGREYRRGPYYPEVLANLIYGPSCLSLEYALAFHGLIPERVYTFTSVTPKKNKMFRTPIGEFSYQHLSMERYPHGIEHVWLSKTHPVLMASAEKALCDYQVHHKIEYVTDSKSALAFLEDDLRIDEWKRFDRQALSNLNKFYRSKVIDHVLELL